MPKAASLKNLRPWSPGQSGNPKGRPRVPRFTERDQHVILAALAGTFGDGTQRAAAKALRTVLTNPQTLLKAMEFYAKLTGELGQSPAPGDDHLEHELRPKSRRREVGVRRTETELNPTGLFLRRS